MILAIELGSISSRTTTSGDTNITSPQSTTVQTRLVLFLLVVLVVFNFIYTHFFADVEFFITTLVGIAFSYASEPIIGWTPKLAASCILQYRFVNCQHNWQRFPMRSEVELACWIGVFVGTSIIYTNIFLVCLFGTLSGAFATLVGESLRGNFSNVFVAIKDNEDTAAGTIPPLVLLTGCGIYVIYHSIANI